MESHAGPGQASVTAAQGRAVSKAVEAHVVELDIPFWNLVIFFCECALAAIPAGLLLWVLYWIASAFLAGAAAAR